MENQDSRALVGSRRTVRRVGKLRWQGPRLFGCRASAEASLLWRSYYQAGRGHMLQYMATSHLALLEA